MAVTDTKIEHETSVRATRNFFRTYEALLYKSDETMLWIDGYCAWSVNLCFIEEHSDIDINIVSISNGLDL